MTDTATLIVAGIGTIAGIIGAVAGVLALLYARTANTNAGNAGQVAGESRDLAIEANDLARQSNTIASGARDLAHQANEYSHRAEARETERNDVDWDGDWDPGQPGRYLVTKRGRDDAHHVVATLTYDGHPQTAESDLMRDGDVLTFWFPEALADYQAEYADRQNPHDVITMSGMAYTHFVNERIQWNTPLGSPHVSDGGGGLTTFSVYFNR